MVGAAIWLSIMGSANAGSVVMKIGAKAGILYAQLWLAPIQEGIMAQNLGEASSISRAQADD